MYKFDFSSAEIKRFIDNCGFTDEEIVILHMRRKGKSIVQIAMDLGLSERTAQRRVKSINHKIIREIS